MPPHPAGSASTDESDTKASAVPINTTPPVALASIRRHRPTGRNKFRPYTSDAINVIGHLGWVEETDTHRLFCLLRHLFEQLAESFDFLPNVQPLLHRPNAGGNGVHHGDLQIFFEQMDNV